MPASERRTAFPEAGNTRVPGGTRLAPSGVTLFSEGMSAGRGRVAVVAMTPGGTRPPVGGDVSWRPQ
ncbi:hypothetical protein ACFYY8_32030 [Streptosporangium sp. NPDC001559]|uniref:hypothetical protein n=1 Tax=Streptosporangium sp. NPDC001559 TaxID=3366187 RepID=UPI0036E40E3F